MRWHVNPGAHRKGRSAKSQPPPVFELGTQALNIRLPQRPVKSFVEGQISIFWMAHALPLNGEFTLEAPLPCRAETSNVPKWIRCPLLVDRQVWSQPLRFSPLWWTRVTESTSSSAFGGRAARAHLRAKLLRIVISSCAALAEAGAVVTASVAVGVSYHFVFYPAAEALPSAIGTGLVVALLFVSTNASRHAYSVQKLSAFPAELRGMFTTWNFAAFATLALGFLFKSSSEFSRGAALLFYLGGFAAVLGGRVLLARAARQIITIGHSSLRRTLVVGRQADVEAFYERWGSARSGSQIVLASILREATDLPLRNEQLAEDIRLAVGLARFTRPEDVFIALPWSEKDLIERCVEAFLTVPASIHLGPERILERFTKVKRSHFSPMGLNLVGEPLSILDIALKRAFDMIVSAAALVVLAPFFLLLALAIKLDSPGPALFVQRRHGFNQEPFAIYKFRSMMMSAPDSAFVQARKGDARITRVGRRLRRWNIDELPQLLNVLIGDMSLVGPRPHALSHDRAFEERVALYARRHNVRPGITGWAQVNGFRGETVTDEQMRRRVEHDLYYIDNWSFWLDLRILVMTVISRKAYRNAY